MRDLLRIIGAVIFLLVAQGCERDLATNENGTYVLCREAFGHQREVLELKDGRFRYWFSSDAHPQLVMARGSYSLNDDRVVLATYVEIVKVRYRRVCHGQAVLLREDAKTVWDAKGEVQEWGALIRVTHPADELWPASQSAAEFARVFAKLPPCLVNQ